MLRPSVVLPGERFAGPCCGVLTLDEPPAGTWLICELCHVRYRDNLTAAIHMFVETVFWFHPLVWWMGMRMVRERERACDEEVLRRGSEPRVYAEGILSVCELYVESPWRARPGSPAVN
jgi:beta-lactamase regulating signal transducer with metallopeptidase domain